MQWLSWARRRLAVLFHRDRFARDLQEEMQNHLEMQAEENELNGMDPSEARHAAQRRFGNSALIAEESRDTWGWGPLERLARDVKIAFRRLGRDRAFTFVAVLTLALGIGANSAIFSAVNTVLLRPLPFRDPGRLVGLISHNLAAGYPRFQNSLPDILDWKAQNHSFEDIAILGASGFNLTGEGDPEQINGLAVSANLLPMLGLQPVLGRGFLAEEDRPGGPKVVLIGQRLWERRFGSSPSIAGRAVQLDGQIYTIIGVLPSALGMEVAMGFSSGPRLDYIVPLAPDPKQFSRGNHNLVAVARLKNEASIESAQADLNFISARLEQAYPRHNTGYGVTVSPLATEIVGDARRPLLVLLGAVSLVLLIACANVANLLLARASTRQKEMAIRMSIGAGRWRLVRQLLTESLTLSGIGGLLGLLLAAVGTRILARATSLDLPHKAEIAVDFRVLLFTCAMAVLTGIIFGLVPALACSRADASALSEALKEGGRGVIGGRSTNRSRAALVVTEVALALTLLIGAGLLLRSFWKLLQVNPGFRAEHVAAVDLSLPYARYRGDAAPRRFVNELLQKVESLPGVQSAAVSDGLPLEGGRMWIFSVAGQTHAAGKEPNAHAKVVSAAYFQTLGIALREGRAFNHHDTFTSPRVVLVSECMARRLWPGEGGRTRAVEQQLRLFGRGDPYRVIGVMADVKHAALEEEAEDEMYFLYDQMPGNWISLSARSTGDPAALFSMIRDAARSIDHDLPLTAFRTMDTVLDSAVAPRRFQMRLLAIFAALALLLAVVGIYGVMAYSISQRTHEIGIRMALGASSMRIQTMVWKQALRLVGIGIALGCLAALWLSRLLAGLLFGVQPADPLTFACVATLLAAVGLAAGYIPGRHAARIAPSEALHCE
jgi:putative ABC transport system permease protein